MIYDQTVKLRGVSIYNKLETIRDLKVERLNNWLDGRIGDVNTIASDKEIRILEKIHEGKKEDIQQNIDVVIEARNILRRYLKNYNAFHDIFIISPHSKRILISTHEEDEGVDFSESRLLTEVLQTRELFIKDIFYSTIENMPCMAFSIPVFSLTDSSHIFGILVARIDLDASLYKVLLNRTGMGKTGETLIVNKDAVALNDLRWHDNARLNLEIKTIAALEASLGNTGILETRDYRGKPVLAAYTYIPRTGWGFVAKQDIKEIYAPIHRLRNSTLIIGIITFFGVVIAAFRVSKIISVPISELRKGSQIIGKGNLDHKVGTVRKDEIGQLSRTFDQMTDNLKIVTASRDRLNKEIVKREQAEEAIHYEKDKLINILDSMEDGVYIVNWQHDIEYINPVLKKEFGPIKGCKCYKYFHDRKEECPWCKNKEVFGGQTVRWEWYSNKTSKTYDLLDTPLKNHDGSISKLEIFRDITERKKTEEAVKKSELWLTNIYNSLEEGVFVVTPDRVLKNVNKAAEKIFGYTKDELFEHSTEILHVDHAHYLQFGKRIEEAFNRGETAFFEFKVKRKNGEVFPTEHTVSLLKDDSGSPIGIVSVVRDITKRRQLEREVLEIEETERQRIGHDLHDDLGQQLTGISFKSQHLETQLKEKQIPEAEIAAKLTSLIDKARNSMENLSQGLSPILGKGEESLWIAMKELAFNTEKIFNIPCIFKYDEHVWINNRPAAINLYRIAQEAVTNAAKHAGPRSIESSIYRENNKIIITIKDDGKGISMTEDNTDGMGLRIMHYRADMIGATLNVRPNVNGGTLVECIYTDETESSAESS